MQFNYFAHSFKHILLPLSRNRYLEATSRKHYYIQYLQFLANFLSWTAFIFLVCSAYVDHRHMHGNG